MNNRYGLKDDSVWVEEVEEQTHGAGLYHGGWLGRLTGALFSDRVELEEGLLRGKKATAKTQSWSGPVVNRGPYDRKSIAHTQCYTGREVNPRPYNLIRSRRRFVWARLTGTSDCLRSFIFSM